jgi:shikimate dehydrogenase
VLTQYGLIGQSLSHSFSVSFFTNYFKQQNIAAIYNNYEIENEKLLADFFKNTTCNFFNVTIPYKQAVLPYIQQPDEKVKLVGAANCLKKINNIWHATNTDVIGLQLALQTQLQEHHTHALILGSGGAALAAQYVCNQLNIRHQIVSSTQQVGSISYADLSQAVIEKYTLIINTTPLGMAPNINSFAPIPYNYLSKQHYLFDMVYNPTETLFLLKGKEQGAQTQNGLMMLQQQALAAWEWWGNDL